MHAKRVHARCVRAERATKRVTGALVFCRRWQELAPAIRCFLSVCECKNDEAQGHRGCLFCLSDAAPLAGDHNVA